MARIKTYVKDTVITDGDKLLGTDAANNNRTVNIEIGSLKTYMEDNAEFNSDTTVFNQSSASTTWSISHNMGKYPSVYTEDSSGNIIIGQVDYQNNALLTITFSAATAGVAYLN